MVHPGPLLALALAALLPSAAAWHECASQAVFPGGYGLHALANLSEFRAGLMGCAAKYCTQESHAGRPARARQYRRTATCARLHACCGAAAAHAAVPHVSLGPCCLPPLMRAATCGPTHITPPWRRRESGVALTCTTPTFHGASQTHSRGARTKLTHLAEPGHSCMLARCAPGATHKPCSCMRRAVRSFPPCGAPTNSPASVPPRAPQPAYPAPAAYRPRRRRRHDPRGAAP